jgi:hypothetical protein
VKVVPTRRADAIRGCAGLGTPLTRHVFDRGSRGHNLRVRRAAILVVVASIVGAGATAPAAGAPDATTLIRPGVGIGKVRLGMTHAQVRRALGPHMVVNARERRFGLTYLELAYDYSAYTVGFLGAPGKLRVVSVATSLRRERTRNGLGPGTSLPALRRALRGERCRLRRAAQMAMFQTECILHAPSGARTTFIAGEDCRAFVPRCDRWRVFEVAVSRGAR